MKAFVRLTEVEQGPVYFQTETIKSVTTYGYGAQVYIGDDFQRYTVEESPDAVFKLIQESEVARILRIDEVEEERSQLMRERANVN